MTNSTRLDFSIWRGTNEPVIVWQANYDVSGSTYVLRVTNRFGQVVFSLDSETDEALSVDEGAGTITWAYSIEDSNLVPLGKLLSYTLERHVGDTEEVHAEGRITGKSDGSGGLESISLDMRVPGIQGAPGVPGGDLPSRAYAITQSIEPSRQSLRTSGYSSPGDGGGALYKRRQPSDPPLSEDGFTTLDGAEWEKVPGSSEAEVVALQEAVSGVDGLVEQAEAAAEAAEAAADAAVAVAGLNSDVISTGVRRVNLFDKDTITDNSFINNSTGNPQSNASYFCSDFIDIVPDLEYTLTRGNFIGFYDGDEVFISGSNPATQPYTFTAPEGALKFRLSSQKVNAPASTFMMVEGDTLPFEYVAFDKVLDLSKAHPRSLQREGIANGAVGTDQVDFVRSTKNLLRYERVDGDLTLTLGYMANNGNVTADSNYYHSAYIPVEAEAEYHAEGNSPMRMWCFFSAPGIVLAGGSNSPGDGFTTPTGCAGVIVTLYLGDTEDIDGAIRSSTFQLEEGSERTSYVSPGLVFDPDGYGAAGPSSGWADMNWAQIGDSNTAGDTWPGQVASKFGLLYSDYGSAGTQIGGPSNSTTAMFSDTRIEAVSEDTDVVIVFGGTNDWYDNRALGSASSSDSTEFNGALNLMIGKMLARWPDKILALATLPYTEALTYVSKGWSNAYTNTAGLTPKDYADAIRAACARYNIPCIDVQALAGWNHTNITEYVANDGELLHFGSSLGAERVKAVYGKFFREMEPV